MTLLVSRTAKHEAGSNKSERSERLESGLQAGETDVAPLLCRATLWTISRGYRARMDDQETAGHLTLVIDMSHTISFFPRPLLPPSSSTRLAGTTTTTCVHLEERARFPPPR